MLDSTCSGYSELTLNLFGKGGGRHDGVEKLSSRTLKLSELFYKCLEHKKAILLVTYNSSVTIATSLLRSTRDFLKSSSHMFPYDQILTLSMRIRPPPP